MASLPALTDGIALTHFIVAESCEVAPFFVDTGDSAAAVVASCCLSILSYSIGER